MEIWPSIYIVRDSYSNKRHTTLEKLILTSLLFVWMAQMPNFLSINSTTSFSNGDPEIIWSTARRLNWDDFKAQPNGQTLTGAVTHSTIKVMPEANKWTGRVTVVVQAVFACNKSWAREKAKESDYLLNHEQRHFDIAELYARKIRQALAEERITIKNYKEVRATIIQPLFREYVKFDEEYDHQTVHGLNKETQSVWNNRIDDQLEDMSLYLND